MSTMTERAQLHEKAKLSMRRGDYEDGGLLLQKALQGHQPYIGILVDLAFCYYSTGRIDAYLRTVEKAEIEFAKCREYLSEESLERTLLAMGKLEEEAGRICEALEFYSQGFLTTSRIESRRAALFQAQELRLKSSLELEEARGLLYQSCLSVRMSRGDWHFELEHALLLSEARISSTASLVQELTRLKMLVAHPSDLSLVIYDCLELKLRQGPLDPELKKWYLSQKMVPEGAYEMIVHELTLGQVPEFSEWKNRTRELSPFSTIRLLQILENRKADIEFSWQLIQLKTALSENNRRLLVSSQKENRQGLVQFDATRNLIAFGGHEMTLNAAGLEKKWIQLFSVKKEIPTEEALMHLYQEPWSEASFQKLRVAIHRLNDKISKQLGLPKLFTVKKNTVQCSHEIGTQV